MRLAQKELIMNAATDFPETTSVKLFQPPGLEPTHESCARPEEAAVLQRTLQV